MASLFKVALIIIVVLAVGSNLLAFFLEKFYKRKVNKKANQDKEI